MVSKNGKQSISIFVCIVFLVQTVFYGYAGAVITPDLISVNPAIVLDPVVYSYMQCQEKYTFCSCEVTGPGINSADYDTNSDGYLDFMEMRDARNQGFWSQESLGDTNFLACHYDPPSPGPYEPHACSNLFGADDCVCVGHASHFYPQCYSKTIVQMSPEPVSVPEEYCSHRVPGGFDNCYCDEQSGAYVGGDGKCFVMPQTADSTWDCESESIRIFSGSKYSCRTKDGYVFRPDCCPPEMDCEIDGYDPGGGDFGTALTAANIAVKAYLAYSGYAATTATAASVGGFAASIGSATAQGELLSTWSTWSSTGAALNPALAALSTGMFYVALAYMVYNIIAGMYNTCKSGEYELGCKNAAELCIYVGEMCIDKGSFGCKKEARFYMCYSSQIAKIVNEYGLPQIYAPGCHEEGCNASYDDCGCRDAYSDGKVKNTRHRGFTIDEFQRLDFSQIPIAEQLVKTLTGGEEAGIDWGTKFDEVEELMTPNTMLNAEGEGSLSTQAPETREDNPAAGSNSVDVGRCTTTPDGELKWPIDSTDYEIVDMSTYPSGTEFFHQLCVSGPKDQIGRTYVAYMGQHISTVLRLASPTPSDGDAFQDVPYMICNPAYISAGWGDTGPFLVGLVKVGAFFSGASCVNPEHIDGHFFEQVPWWDHAYFYEDWTFTRNSIGSENGLYKNSDSLWYSPTIENMGVEYPNTSFYDAWVYWIPESGLQRGIWIDQKGKCILDDTGAEGRQECSDQYEAALTACGTNPVCRNNAHNTYSICKSALAPPFMNPPENPRFLAIDISSHPEMTPPESPRKVFINTTAHPEFDRPPSPKLAVVDVSGHTELTPPSNPATARIDVTSLESAAPIMPDEYDPDTGESTLTPGTFFKNTPQCQQWFLSTVAPMNLEVELNDACRLTAEGTTESDPNHHIVLTRQYACPAGYTEGTDCFLDGPLFFDSVSGMGKAGIYFKDDPLCSTWYNNEMISQKLDYTLSKNCTVAANNPPTANMVHVLAEECPDGYTEGIDCFTDSLFGRDAFDSDGNSQFLGYAFNLHPDCTAWYQQLKFDYGLETQLISGCFIENTESLGLGPRQYQTRHRDCSLLTGFSEGIDCFPDGDPLYDPETGLNSKDQTLFKNDPVCTDWFNVEVLPLGLDVVLEDNCTLSPKYGEHPMDNPNLFTVRSTSECPPGYDIGVDCLQYGEPVYDPEGGFSPYFDRYFKDDPVCKNWFQDQILARNIDAELLPNCTLESGKDFGDDIYPINSDVCPPGTTQGSDCFCECPALADDLLNEYMICSRPSRRNMSQRLVIYGNPAGYNNYYGRSDVEALYENYLP